MISISILNDTIHLRFTEMKSNVEFQRLLDCFKEEFPHAVWQFDRQVWHLPMTDAPQLNWFVYRYFGYNAIVYENQFASTG